MLARSTNHFSVRTTRTTRFNCSMSTHNTGACVPALTRLREHLCAISTPCKHGLCMGGRRRVVTAAGPTDASTMASFCFGRGGRFAGNRSLAYCCTLVGGGNLGGTNIISGSRSTLLHTRMLARAEASMFTVTGDSTPLCHHFGGATLNRDTASNHSDLEFFRGIHGRCLVSRGGHRNNLVSTGIGCMNV